MKHSLHQHKFLYLLFALLAFFLLNPILVYTKIELHYFGILFSLVIFFCVYILKRGKLLLLTAIVLAVVIILGYWSTHVLHLKNAILDAEYYFIILFFGFITIIVLNHVMRDQHVNLNTLCGAICGYLLIALLWSFVYVLIYHYSPESFYTQTPIQSTSQGHIEVFIYFSFCTQSTLGYGDIVPISNIARTFAWLQAVVGQIYLTVWIAQLVGMHIAVKSQKNKVRGED